jgi:hypothetical protein
MRGRFRPEECTMTLGPEPSGRRSVSQRAGAQTLRGEPGSGSPEPFEPSGGNRRRRTRPARVGPPHAMRALLLFSFVIFAFSAVLLFLSALHELSLMPTWFAAPSRRNPVAALEFGVASVVIGTMAEILRRRAVRPAHGVLTFVVGPDELGFERHGEVVDRVRRSEVGVVVIDEFRQAGVLAMTVRGRTGKVVGRWDTGWLGKIPRSPWRALGRFGYPRAIEFEGQLRKVSDDAPAWLRTPP